MQGQEVRDLERPAEVFLGVTASLDEGLGQVQEFPKQACEPLLPGGDGKAHGTSLQGRDQTVDGGPVSKRQIEEADPQVLATARDCRADSGRRCRIPNTDRP